MTASCFSTPFASQELFAPRAAVRRQVSARVRQVPLVLPLVSALVLSAALLVPEQPIVQADICQRHNGAAACRVW